MTRPSGFSWIQCTVQLWHLFCAGLLPHLGLSPPKVWGGKHTNSSEVHSWGKAVISDIFQYPLGLDLPGRKDAARCLLVIRIPSLGCGCNPTNWAVLSTPLCSLATPSQSQPEGSKPPFCKLKQVGKTGYSVPPERGVKTRAAVIVPLWLMFIQTLSCSFGAL